MNKDGIEERGRALQDRINEQLRAECGPHNQLQWASIRDSLTAPHSEHWEFMYLDQIGGPPQVIVASYRA